MTGADRLGGPGDRGPTRLGGTATGVDPAGGPGDRGPTRLGGTATGADPAGGPGDRGPTRLGGTATGADPAGGPGDRGPTRLGGTATGADLALEQYRSEFNRQFGRTAAESQPAWRSAKGLDLARICSFQYEATVHNDNTVHKDGLVIDIPPGPKRRTYAQAKVDLRHGLDGVMRVYHRDELIAEAKVSAPMPKALKAKSHEASSSPGRLRSASSGKGTAEATSATAHDRRNHREASWSRETTNR